MPNLPIGVPDYEPAKQHLVVPLLNWQSRIANAVEHQEQQRSLSLEP